MPRSLIVSLFDKRRWISICRKERAWPPPLPPSLAQEIVNPLWWYKSWGSFLLFQCIALIMLPCQCLSACLIEGICSEQQMIRPGIYHSCYSLVSQQAVISSCSSGPVMILMQDGYSDLKLCCYRLMVTVILVTWCFVQYTIRTFIRHFTVVRPVNCFPSV